MLDKIKKMFSEKDEKKKNENLVAFLIILVITLVIINKILTKDNTEKVPQDSDTELVTGVTDSAEISSSSQNLKSELENILSKMEGVRKS